MNSKIILLTFSACLALVSQTLTFAQKQKKWNVGISAGYGRDYFFKKFHGPKNEIPPGSITHFHSFNSLKLDLYVERFLRPRLSAKVKVEYSVLEMPNHVMFDITSFGWFPKNERHHWGSAAIGIRGYLKSKMPFKIFADLAAQGDYFLGSKTFPAGYEHKFSRDTENYYRFVPSINAGAGIRWKRFTLTADYQMNVARTFAIDNPKIYNNPKHLKRSITRQGISLKATFLLSKAGEKWY